MKLSRTTEWRPTRNTIESIEHLVKRVLFVLGSAEYFYSRDRSKGTVAGVGCVRSDARREFARDWDVT